jgi:DNA-binding LacI/PurR family transcriptional regulator
MIVFLSQRTQDTHEFVDPLCAFLRDHIPSLDLRLGDKAHISPGHGWHDWIELSIRDCDLFLAIIGPRWERMDPLNDKHSIYDEEDIVRWEMEEAKRREKPICVLLVDRDDVKEEELPPSLKWIITTQYSVTRSPFKEQVGLAALLAELRKQYDGMQTKPVVLLSSTLAFLSDGESTEGLDYFATLVMTVIQTLNKRGRDVILMVPLYGSEKSTLNAAENQRELLRAIVDNYSKYSGVIIAPFELESLREELERLLKKDRDFPVATIDKVYPLSDPVPGCACDGETNGKLAAENIIEYFRVAKIINPNIVVLQGWDGSEDRINGFIRQIDEHNRGATERRQIHLAVSRKMPFLAFEAARRAREYRAPGSDWTKLNDSTFMSFIQKPIKKRHERIDAFFCCNDEMALGVWDVFNNIRSTPPLHRVEATVVVGFDGIASVRRKISDKDPWLLNTVDVRVRDQVQRLVNAFDKALGEHKRIADLGVIPGTLVDTDQENHVRLIREARRAALVGSPASILPGPTVTLKTGSL